MVKMYFPNTVNVGTTGYKAGQINEVIETPGSVDRWLIRGCTIVEYEDVEKPSTIEVETPNVETELENEKQELTKEVLEDLLKMPTGLKGRKRRSK